MGTPEPPATQPISYAVGPSQLRRMLQVVKLPPALGVASLVLSLSSLMLVQSARELGDTYVIAHGSRDTLPVYRWATGIQLGVAALAVVLSIIGIVLLLGRRPKVTVQPADFDADAATLDRMEAATLAQAGGPPAWMATLVGASLVVGIVALCVNAIAFGYAMTASTPPAYNITTY